MTFTPQCSPTTTHYFSSEDYQVLITTHLPTPEGWKAELAWEKAELAINRHDTMQKFLQAEKAPKLDMSCLGNIKWQL